jgi:Zn-finger nucleic acid-binding protein
MMNCPTCKNIQLVMMERQGIEIDYCPQCRGVWLDRGELDKIIERNAAEQRPVETRPAEPHYREAKYDKHYDKHYGGHGEGYHPRKKSFLSDLFD